MSILKSTHSLLYLVILILVALACSFQPSELFTSSSSIDGTIIFESDGDGNYDIYTMDLGTGKTKRLTNNSSNDVSPAYDASRDRISFTSDRNGLLNLFVMDTFGWNQEVFSEVITDHVDYSNWSSDGTHVAVSMVDECDPSECYYDIYVMDSNGANRINLTNSEDKISNWVPNWSPDGKRIAFASDRDGDSEVYTINIDGTGLVQLTENAGYDGNPEWSSDGSRILFDSDREGGDWDIFVMNSDGGDVTPITQNATSDYAATWSADGNWLVYISNFDGDEELFLIDIHGENQQRLTNNDWNDLYPVWMR